MYVPSRSQCAVMAIAVLPLLLLALPATAQTSAVSNAGDNSSSSVSQLSAVPITAPVAVETPDATVQAPSPQLDADPIPSAPPISASADAGPTSTSATAGFHAHSATLTRQQLADRATAAHGGFGTDGVLMIVGGAGFIAGLIIGGGAGTAIAIAGAVMALYGLYLYLR
jgi:hypothetical protein